MRISTRLNLIRIKLQHKRLMLKIWYPKAYQATSLMAVLFVVGLAVGGYVMFGQQNAQVLSAQDQLEIKHYSLNGQVVSISDNKLVVAVNVIQTEGAVNQVVETEKTYLITGESDIITVSIADGQAVLTPATSADLAVGKKIAVYSTTNPNASNEISAARIELINL